MFFSKYILGLQLISIGVENKYFAMMSISWVFYV